MNRQELDIPKNLIIDEIMVNMTFASPKIETMVENASSSAFLMFLQCEIDRMCKNHKVIDGYICEDNEIFKTYDFKREQEKRALKEIYKAVFELSLKSSLAALSIQERIKNLD